MKRTKLRTALRRFYRMNHTHDLLMKRLSNKRLPCDTGNYIYICKNHDDPNVKKHLKACQLWWQCDFESVDAVGRRYDRYRSKKA